MNSQQENNKASHLRVLSGNPDCYGAATVQILSIYEYFPLVAISVYLSAHDKKFIQQTGQYRCQHELSVHAGTKGVRQSPTMPAGIVTNTDNSMLVMVGETIRQVRADRNVDTVDPGKSYGRVSYSVINTCVRTIAGRR